MIGFNALTISGNVGASLSEGTTGTGEKALSFDLICQHPARTGVKALRVWLRVNVYDPDLLERIRPRLVKGVYLMVQGELMNRSGRSGDLLEVRALQIITIERGTPTA